MPGDEAVQRTVQALEANNVHVVVVADGAAAKAEVLRIIPVGAEVMNVTSTTLDVIGISQEVMESGRYVAVRKRIYSVPKEQSEKARRENSAPDWVVGSVHAVTQDGHVAVASQSGSQLPLYAASAKNVLWVVGAQKIVPDLAAAERRLREHALPLEDARARKAYGTGSAINFMLVMNRAPRPGRITMVLVREPLGF
ncbi:MAG: LUD domain-containing protein [Thermoplasmatota archaeon]|nr:lactate utilization protein [Halobacteriales archaeon]